MAGAAGAIERHCRAHLPPGFALDVVRHRPGSTRPSRSTKLPALRQPKRILANLWPAAAPRSDGGDGADQSIVFRKQLGVPTVFFSFSTADEDYHAPNEFFRLKSFNDGLLAWARLYERL